MKFYKLSGIGYPVKIHKFYILLFALCFYNIAYGQNQPIIGIYEKPTSIKSIRNH